MRKKRILVIVPLVLLLAAVMPLMVFAGGPWSDNFDSYSTGMDLHGVGGWKGWGDVPSASASTTSDQARSTPNSVEIMGASDLVHEYSTASGKWVYTAWQYIPGNMTGTTYFIMLNRYDDACVDCNWSVEVQFDSISGTMIDDGGTAMPQPYITDQWVEIRIEIDLDADTQDFYYNGLLFYSGTWNGYVTGAGTGSNVIANVDLFANGATSVYYDDMSLVEVPAGEPGLEIAKSPDAQDVVSGGNADFTITVTNTGTLTWTDVTVTDAAVSACDNSFSNMAPGAVASYSCTDTGVTTTYTNTAVAVGTVTGGPTMTVTDTAVVNVVPPTSVSLSSFGGENTNIPAGLVVAALGIGLAAGFIVVSRRRHQEVQ
ncbi:MAG: hypothetical protein WAM60_15640 [Candidatus Promineifilaceae bacterium]